MYKGIAKKGRQYESEPCASRIPDLRYSAALHSSEAWAAVVLKGLMQANGMASFAPVLDAGEAEAIRAYVISQAHAAQQRSN